MGRYLGEKGAKFILDLIRPLEAKLNTIAEGANKTVVDSALSSTSTNPVQNKVINTALEGKAARYHDHGCYIDGIAFDTGSNLSRLGTCTTASYDTAKEVTIEGFEETEECANAILYIQFTATYEGGATDTHTISINGGEPLAVYYKGEMLNWETFFSNYPFCDGQIHQFKYFHHPMGTYLELIAVQNRAVANNLTTTDTKIALGAPMGKQLAETDANLQGQIDELNANKVFTQDVTRWIAEITNLTEADNYRAKTGTINVNANGNYCEILSFRIGNTTLQFKQNVYDTKLEVRSNYYNLSNNNMEWTDWKQLI